MAIKLIRSYRTKRWEFLDRMLFFMLQSYLTTREESGNVYVQFWLYCRRWSWDPFGSLSSIWYQQNHVGLETHLVKWHLVWTEVVKGIWLGEVKFLNGGSDRLIFGISLAKLHNSLWHLSKPWAALMFHGEPRRRCTACETINVIYPAEAQGEEIILWGRKFRQAEPDRLRYKTWDGRARWGDYAEWQEEVQALHELEKLRKKGKQKGWWSKLEQIHTALVSKNMLMK